jgi:hypothetical protein
MSRLTIGIHRAQSMLLLPKEQTTIVATRTPGPLKTAANNSDRVFIFTYSCSAEDQMESLTKTVFQQVVISVTFGTVTFLITDHHVRHILESLKTKFQLTDNFLGIVPVCLYAFLRTLELTDNSRYFQL